MRSRRLALLIVALVLGAAPASELRAQDRNALIDQARAELVGSQPALDLLLAAANPALAPIDSAWTVSVFDLADNLINVGESDLAAVWLRWAARHGAQWPIDRTWYSQIVTQAYDIAAQAVAAGGGLGEEDAALTSWRWPDSFQRASNGTLEVAGSATSGVSVTVQGFGTLGPGGSMDLAPGTYVITASAPGSDQVQVSREVLPGVTTVMGLDLPPQLPDNLESTVSASLARVSYVTNGQLVCTNGVIADTRGLVLTTLSGLQSATQIQVATPAGTFSNIDIGATDATRDLAVLRLGQNAGPVLPRATNVSDGQYAWTIFQPGCDTPTRARTRLSGWSGRPTSLVPLLPLLPAPATGAPLVDRTGALLGMVTAPGSVLPADLADDLLAEARGALAASIQSAGGGGGGGGVPSWVWIAGGVGAAGAGAALLLGGGSNGPPPPPPPTTGSITLHIPSIIGSP